MRIEILNSGQKSSLISKQNQKLVMVDDFKAQSYTQVPYNYFPALYNVNLSKLSRADVSFKGGASPDAEAEDYWETYGAMADRGEDLELLHKELDRIYTEETVKYLEYIYESNRIFFRRQTGEEVEYPDRTDLCLRNAEACHKMAVLETVQASIGIMPSLDGFNVTNYFKNAKIHYDDAKVQEDDPRRALVRYHYGNFLTIMGDHQSALDELSDALEIAKKKNSKENSILQAKIHMTLGGIVGRNKKYPEAKEEFQESIKICTGLVDNGQMEEDNLLFTKIRMNFARVLVEAGESGFARDILDEIRPIVENKYKDNHKLRGYFLVADGLSEQNLGNHNKARECFEQSLLELKKISAQHPNIECVQKLLNAGMLGPSEN